MPRSRVKEPEEEEEEEATEPFAEEEEEAVGGAWEAFMLVSLPLEEEEGWEESVECVALESVECVALRSTEHATISGTKDYKTSN